MTASEQLAIATCPACAHAQMAEPGTLVSCRECNSQFTFTPPQYQYSGVAGISGVETRIGQALLSAGYTSTRRPEWILDGLHLYVRDRQGRKYHILIARTKG